MPVSYGSGSLVFTSDGGEIKLEMEIRIQVHNALPMI